MDIYEALVDVPWGKISVKIHGSFDKFPVLVTHGIMDNAGAFDRLIKHLPKNYQYICIDLPSHGKSTWWPQHIILNTFDNIQAIKAIADHFAHPKYVLMCHCYGCHASTLFTQLYPDKVYKLIMLDGIYTFPQLLPNFRSDIRNVHKQFLTINAKQPKHYTAKEAFDIIKSKRFVEINDAATAPIFDRSYMKTNQGENENATGIITTDPRLKWPFYPLQDLDFAKEFIKTNPIKCPTLMILIWQLQYESLNEIVELFKSYDNFDIVYLDSTHDAHNEFPELIAPHVAKFLTNSKI